METNLLSTSEQLRQAQQVVERFVLRYDKSYYHLARYAAMPLILTPELLNYLHSRFLRGRAPWIAEADLLLSELCRQVGYELYAMDAAVRAYLLADMEKKEGLDTMREVARLLIHYVRSLARTAPNSRRSELQAQQWAAMIYLDKYKEDAVREIATSLGNPVQPTADLDAKLSSLIDKAEMNRLAHLVRTFAPQLGAYPSLLNYAELVSRVISDVTGVETRKLRNEGKLSETKHVLGVSLPPLEYLAPREPDDIESEKRSKNIKIGRYQISKRLGNDGIATVYLAHDPLLKRDVAIKVLKSDRPALRRRFQMEAKILLNLKNAAIVPVYDMGEYEGQPFLVMRFMAGGSLRTCLEAGPLSLDEASHILNRLVAALEAAHKQGIIHRNIKPANILLDEEGLAYLSDFGTAIVVGEERETVRGAVTGSPKYMAPEQITWAHELGVRTDVYQLGVVLFEMLTGERPFTGDDVMVKHIHEPVPRATAVNPKLPSACDDLLAKAMAKEPSERFATPGELAAALAGIITNESVKQQPDGNKLFNIRECYEQGIAAFEEEDWEEAVSKLMEVIEYDFEYPGAASKLTEARERLAEKRAAVAKQQEIEFTYREADNHFQHERWGQAAAKFQEVVEHQPDFRDARAKLMEARKQEELERLYKTAVGHCEKGEWETAVATFKKIQAIDAAYKEVGVKLQQAEEEVTLAEQYNKALESLTYGKEHYYESRFNRAKKQFQAIQEKWPGYRDVVAKLKEIEKQLTLLELYQSAILYETEGKWPEAIKSYGDLLGQSPVYRDAVSRLVAVKVKREEIYQKGKVAFQQQDWEKAIEQLKQSVGYRDADKLLRQAEKQKMLAQKEKDSSEQRDSQESHMSNELTDLYQILTDYFNEDELRSLCFDIDIRYDNLPGRGKAEKALELVNYARRHGRISELRILIKQLRPHLFQDTTQVFQDTTQAINQEPPPIWKPRPNLLDRLRQAFTRRSRKNE